MPIVLILGDNPFERVGGVSPLEDLSTISSLAILDAHNLDPTLLSGKQDELASCIVLNVTAALCLLHVATNGKC